MFDALPSRSIVWIVDDSPLDADRARRALASDHNVRTFEDGGSVLEELASCDRRDLPRVLVLDWLMPGVSGIDVCHYLRELPDETLRYVAVLLLTVHQRPRQVVEGLAAGANDFLSKPYAEEELRARVNVLARSSQLLERAERAEAVMTNLLANSPDALVGIDDWGRITYLNQEAERILEQPGSQLQGVDVLDVFPALRDWRKLDGNAAHPDVEIAGRIYAPLIRGPSSSQAGSGQAGAKQAGAEQVERSQRGASQRGARVITLRDVTVQRQAEQRRLDLYAIVAHDLRSPLGAAILRIETLLQGTRGPISAPVHEALGKLQRNLRELVAMVNDFLEISRAEGTAPPPDQERVQLRQVAEATIDDFRPLAEARKLHLVLRDPMANTSVLGEPRRLKQALSNLVGNAIKFTPEGGTVEVHVEEESRRVVVRVNDTGCGIAPERLPAVFHRYSRALETEHEVTGSGLGLMIVREIARAHGGDVSVSSVQGQGSSFSFWLPAA